MKCPEPAGLLATVRSRGRCHWRCDTRSFETKIGSGCQAERMQQSNQPSDHARNAYLRNGAFAVRSADALVSSGAFAPTPG